MFDYSKMQNEAICYNEISIGKTWFPLNIRFAFLEIRRTFSGHPKSRRSPSLVAGHFPRKKANFPVSGRASVSLSAAKHYRVRLHSTPLLCGTYTEAHSPTTGSERVELKEGFFWNEHASFYTSIPFLRGEDARAEPASREYESHGRSGGIKKKKKKKEEEEKRGKKVSSFYSEIEVTVVARSPWPARLFPLRFPLFLCPSVKGVHAGNRLNRWTKGVQLCFAR